MLTMYHVLINAADIRN